MPCFTAPVKDGQVLMGVFVSAPAPDGGDDAAPIFASSGGGHSFRALVDTGSTNSCISLRAAAKAGIKPAGKSEVYTVGGLVSVNAYDVNIRIPVTVVGVAKEDESDVSFRDFSKLRVSEAALPGHFDVIVGMDILAAGCGLHVSGDSYTFCT